MSPLPALADAFRELWSSTDLRREVLELLDELADRKRRPTEPLEDLLFHVHATYSREVPEREAGSYTLTAEGDAIFTAAEAAIEDVLDLLRRVTVGADKVERRLHEGQDAKIEVFRDDLYEEGHHAGD